MSWSRHRALASLAAALAAGALLSRCKGGEGGAAGECAFSEVPFQMLDGAVHGLAVLSATDVIAVGGREDRALILRFDGARWTRMAGAGGRVLRGVWAEGPAAAWAVGDGGTILRFDGRAWTREVSQSDADLLSVSGLASDRVWAVGVRAGVQGVALSRGPFAWVPEAVPEPTPPLRAVLAAPDAVWAAGDAGTVLRREAVGGWQLEQAPAEPTLLALAAAPDGTLWAAGGNAAARGVALARGADGWTVAARDLTSPLRALAAVGDGMIAAGDGGAVHAIGARRAEAIPAAFDPSRPPPDLFAAAADGAGGAWIAGGTRVGDSPPQGSVLHRCGDLPGELVAQPPPPAVPDAGLPDGPLAGIGPGQPCPTHSGCRPDLTCWLVRAPGVSICTRPCAGAEQCGELAPACCARPGPQTGTLVCLPESLGACE